MTEANRIGSALIFVSIGHLVLEFSNNFLPVLYPVLIPVMGLNYAQIGLVALVASTVLSFSQPVFGYLSDRWGSYWIVGLSIAWTGIAMGMVGLTSQYSTLLLLVALGAFGSAAFHPPATVTAAANSGSKRGSGISIFSVGGNIGTALSPLWMVFMLGLVGLTATLSITLFAVTYGIIFLLLMRRPRVDHETQSESTTEIVAHRFLLGMFLIIAATMFRSWYQVAFMTYLPTWIEESGGTLALGSRFLSLFLLSISVGSIVGGISGDRIGYLAVLIISLATIPFFHYGFMHTTGSLQLLMIFLSGVAVGSTFPTSIVLVLDAWPSQRGFASGLLMGLGWWPGGLGTSLTGILADTYSLTWALKTLTFVPLFGFVCLLAYWLVTSLRRGASPATPD